MSTEIKMPQLGESVTEGTVGRWLKQPGERVEKYEALLEVTTDKVDTEVPSPVAGIVREIKVPEGNTVSVGTLLAILDTGDSPLVQPTAAESPPAPTPQASASQTSSGSAPISPVVARLASEHNLDLSKIQGTGQGGRITKQDVMKYLETHSSQQKQPTSGARPGEITAPPPAQITREPALQEIASSGPLPGAPATPPAFVPPMAATVPSEPIPEDSELVPLSSMRRAIAEHMVRSRRTSPHVTTVAEVDLGRVIAHRERHKANFERQGVKLTFTPYFVQASVAGLQEVPVVNGSYTDQGIVLHRRIHIGVAVALNEGLIVPVLQDADEKNLLGLARAVNDLAERARTRRLKPDETQGGTFTITNHGVSGSLFAMPIINQPQAAILGVGAIQKRPVVITQDGVDAIGIRPMCYISLTFDHRLIDGATADQFLMVLKRTLENYSE